MYIYIILESIEIVSSTWNIVPAGILKKLMAACAQNKILFSLQTITAGKVFFVTKNVFSVKEIVIPSELFCNI